MDGRWTEWTEWTVCSVTCGGGSQSRLRTCEGVAHGGKDCDGPTEEITDCNTDHCPSKPYLTHSIAQSDGTEWFEVLPNHHGYRLENNYNNITER